MRTAVTSGAPRATEGILRLQDLSAVPVHVQQAGATAPSPVRSEGES